MRANRIITVISLAFCLLAFVTTNSALVLGFIVAIVLLCGLSMAFGKRRAAQSRFSVDLRGSCTAGEKVTLTAELERPRALRGRIEMIFVLHDYLMGETVELPITLYPGAGSPERFEVPVDTTACGHVDARLVSAHMLDPLGLVRVRMPQAERVSSITIYPRVLDFDAQVTRSNSATETGASYDPRRSGHDRTEVFDMREFRAGDSLKSVHWKLSARFDDLMVREPSRPAGYDVAILCGLHRIDPSDPARVACLSAGLSVLVSVSMALLRRGTPHTVVYADGSGLRTAQVDSRASFGSMTDSLMCAPLQPRILANAEEYESLAREHNVTKTIVVTDIVDDLMFQKLGAHTNLTILHVSDAEHSGAEESPAGTLIHLPASSVDRIKNLEL